MLKPGGDHVEKKLDCHPFFDMAIAISFTQGNNITPDKLVAEHLKSIGSPEALKDMRSRVLNGAAAVQFLQGTSGNQSNGEFLLASEPKRVALVILFDALEYPGEKFAFDGKDVVVSVIRPGQRSPVADFVYRNNGFVKEGLLGGVLSVAWPFLNLKEKNAEIQCSEGTLDGRPVYAVGYRPQKNLGDLKIRLFFDRKTFRHLQSEYSAAIMNDLTATRNVVSSGSRVRDLSELGQLPEGAVKGGFSVPSSTIMEMELQIPTINLLRDLTIFSPSAD